MPCSLGAYRRPRPAGLALEEPEPSIADDPCVRPLADGADDVPVGVDLEEVTDGVGPEPALEDGPGAVEVGEGSHLPGEEL